MSKRDITYSISRTRSCASSTKHSILWERKTLKMMGILFLGGNYDFLAALLGGGLISVAAAAAGGGASFLGVLVADLLLFCWALRASKDDFEFPTFCGVEVGFEVGGGGFAAAAVLTGVLAALLERGFGAGSFVAASTSSFLANDGFFIGVVTAEEEICCCFGGGDFGCCSACAVAALVGVFFGVICCLVGLFVGVGGTATPSSSCAFCTLALERTGLCSF